MAVFSYRVTTRDGVITEGLIDAIDQKAAVETLRDAGGIPLKIIPESKRKKDRFSPKSSKVDVQTFTQELYVLLNAGLPLDRSLNVLSEVFEKKKMQSIIQEILKAIREGKTFSEALQMHPKIFPRIYVNMIRAGEASGIMDVILEKLNEFLESSRELKEHIFSAMIYPVILCVTSALSILILLVFVIPKFSLLFKDMGGTLPLTTQILVMTSSVLLDYWWVFLSFIASGFFFLRHYLKTDRGRHIRDVALLKILGDMIVKLETARFCRTLGTLLTSGVPVLQALANAREVIANQAISGPLMNLTKETKEGKGIAGPIAATRVFPTLAVSMIKVGEETGQMADMLIKVAAAYEKSLKETIKRIIGLLEPIMILSLGIIIGFIVVSMLAAILSITDIPF